MFSSARRQADETAEEELKTRPPYIADPNEKKPFERKYVGKCYCGEVEIAVNSDPVVSDCFARGPAAKIWQDLSLAQLTVLLFMMTSPEGLSLSTASLASLIADCSQSYHTAFAGCQSLPLSWLPKDSWYACMNFHVESCCTLGSLLLHHHASRSNSTEA